LATLDGGALLQNIPTIWRKMQHLALAMPITAIAAAGIAFGIAKPAFAEFEIQEADIEKGEIELEYRGALHWGLADPDFDPLRQSHEFEMQMGITDYWLISVTPNLEQSLGDNLEASSIEVGTQFQFLKRKGNGVALAFQASYAQATVQGNANEIEFGPIVEVVEGPVSFTFDPLFTKQQGEFADQEGLGFEYGWQLKYQLKSRWALALEMFGEIDDLANPGSFNDQNHSLGPTLYYTFGKVDTDEGTAADEDDDKKDEKSGREAATLTLGVGLQFGLTGATSDTALKLNGQLEF
jgi:hypothetical protein